ncbi:type 1 glutamine amidotransferase domain-containing protein [Frateuria defendens]|uniref:type 1 glutamine amidotransferase domain-containing protein n=1 Tax=Frateuria defendens TaxID=2219559 RepID=UPI0009E39BCB|nr:type 1 glutamine amidotransferase domain-containing protein [Frateuria defendens]
MATQRIEGRRVAMLATDGFEYSELTEPKRLLEEAGAGVDVLAPGGSRAGTCASGATGWTWTGRTLGEVDAAGYDALVLPGGVITPDKLRTQPEAVALVQAFARAGKPIAAICHGPWPRTSWGSLRRDLENAGAHWEDREVVGDGQLITSRKPDDIPAFAQAVIEALAA